MDSGSSGRRLGYKSRLGGVCSTEGGGGVGPDTRLDQQYVAEACVLYLQTQSAQARQAGRWGRRSPRRHLPACLGRYMRILPRPNPSLGERMSNALPNTDSREIRSDLERLELCHLHKYPPRVALWRCLGSLRNQPAPGLRRQMILTSSRHQQVPEPLESSQVIANLYLPTCIYLPIISQNTRSDTVNLT